MYIEVLSGGFPQLSYGQKINRSSDLPIKENYHRVISASSLTLVSKFTNAVMFLKLPKVSSFSLVNM